MLLRERRDHVEHRWPNDVRIVERHLEQLIQRFFFNDILASYQSFDQLPDREHVIIESSSSRCVNGESATQKPYKLTITCQFAKSTSGQSMRTLTDRNDILDRDVVVPFDDTRQSIEDLVFHDIDACH